MRKIAALFLLVFVLFVTGCDALTMPADAWLDPHRWDQTEVAKAKLARARLAEAEKAKAELTGM